MAAAATALLVACAACGGGTRNGTDSIAAAWTLEPAPPALGRDTVTRITLRDTTTNALVSGATLRLEGHMSHPGMTPVTTSVIERGPGEYEAQLRFSMAGDWVLVLTGDLPDGRRLIEQLDVVGVRPAE